MDDKQRAMSDIESNVSFIMSSKDIFDFNIITKILGIEPTKCHIKGDAVKPPPCILKYDYTGWLLGKRSKGIWDITQEISQLLEILLPKEKEIIELCSRYNLETEFGCAIYIHSDTPILNFPKDILSQIVRLNATIDIDIINAGSDPAQTELESEN